MAHAVSSTEALEAAIGKAESLVETDYTAGWDDMQAELAGTNLRKLVKQERQRRKMWTRQPNI